MLPENCFLLVSVGELNKNKNHMIIIEAVSFLKDDQIHYVVAGSGEHSKDLRLRAKQLHIENQVHILGYRNDVSELYQCSDVCVFPSIREGQGLAAIEGMASGLPIVVADNRGTRDIVENGTNGFTCDYNSAQQFAEAIRILMNDKELLTRCGTNNIKKSEEYSVITINKLMRELYVNI